MTRVRLLMMLSFMAVAYSFNIDVSLPIVKQSKSSGKTLFGYSVYPHELKEDKQFRMLVGAPLDNMSNYVDSQQPSGAVYSCPITSSIDDCRALLILKLPVNFIQINQPKYQWMGVNVYSDTIKGGSLAYTCAHRFRSQNRMSYKSTVPGQCLAIPNSLVSSPLHSLKSLKPPACPTAPLENTMCMRGTGFASRADLGVLAIGAADEMKGAGVVHFSQRSGSWNQTPTGVKYAYSGYSVALGKIYQSKEVKFTLVSGSPGVTTETSGKGEVRLFAIREQNVSRPRSVLNGETFGGRFGQTVLTLDINGDGWDDLLVGAPDHVDFKEDFKSSSVVGSGAVNVYINEEGSRRNQRTLRKVLTLRPRGRTLSECPKCVDAQFGTAIGSLGDLNMDGLQDVGIGSPGENVVYVYHGHPHTGLTKTPMQVLDGKKISPKVKGFGNSVAGGMDLDGNRYPDVVIGAPFSGHAVILRTRPVIDIIASVVFEPAELQQSLDPTAQLVQCGKDGRCITARIYLSYRHAGDKSVVSEAKLSHKPVFEGMVTMELDKGKEDTRIVFEQGATRTLTKKVILRHSKVVQKNKRPTFQERLYINPHTFIDKMNPISLRLSWILDLKPPSGKGLPDLNQFPVYNSKIAFRTFFLPWTKTCRQPVCVSDLNMKMSTTLQRAPGKYIFYFGREDDFWLNFTITNSREPAHHSVLNIAFTNRLVLLKTLCPFQCKMRDSKLRCPIANPLTKGMTKTCSVHISGSNIVPDTPRLDFVVSLVTVSDNLRGRPMNLTFSADVQILADIRMTSIVEPDMVIYGRHQLLGASSIKHEKKIGPRVSFTLMLENNMKSGVVPASHLTIYWPYEVYGDASEDHGKYLLYIVRPPNLQAATSNGLRCDNYTWTDIINPNRVRLLSRESTKSGRKTSLEYSSAADGAREYEMCSDGLARCRPIRCRLGHLSHKTGSMRIHIEARLWVHTMTEDFPETRFVPIQVNATWRPASRYKVAQLSGNSTSIIMRLLASNTLPRPPRRPDNMWMLTILSILAGVIILGCIILLLWKINFFSRDRRVQEQRLAQRQQAAAEEEERHKYDYMEYD